MAPRPRPTDPFTNRVPRAGLPTNATIPRSLRMPTPEESRRGVVIAWAPANFGIYRFVIDRLQPQERFRVETQFGNYEMSAAEFDATFPRIVNSSSYQTGSPAQHGPCVYVVEPPPANAGQFKV